MYFVQKYSEITILLSFQDIQFSTIVILILSVLIHYICTIDVPMKRLIIIGSLLSAIAVMLGAFGAHALKSVLSITELQTYETGVRYQFIHSIGIILIAILYHIQPSKLLLRAGMFLYLGILFFSFSLYLLALKEVLGISSWTFLGPITPIGGVFFITGWVLTAWSFLSKRHE